MTENNGQPPEKSPAKDAKGVSRETKNMTSMSSNYRSSRDALGTGKLAVDGVLAVTDIVEDMHQTIVSMAGALGKSESGRTSGISGLVYQSIRSISGLVGSAMALPLQHLSELADDRPSSREREAILAAINGVMGDYLASSANPLAISMQFRRDGRTLDKAALAEQLRSSNGRLLIMVHGLCMNDLQWQRECHDHGAILAAEHDLSSVYLHYNSGKHISDNGREFSELLQMLVDISDVPLSLNLLAHSMGGLVSRSAFYYAQSVGHTWPEQIEKLICLGTPHHGAALEKGGNWLENILKVSPYSAPFARLARLRSAGVTDLRYGFVREEDWYGKDAHALSEAPLNVLPLPGSVDAYAIAGTIRKEAGKFDELIVGDGLVNVASALGHHKLKEKTLGFAGDRQWVLRGVNHMALLNHPEVLEVLEQIFSIQGASR